MEDSQQIDQQINLPSSDTPKINVPIANISRVSTQTNKIIASLPSLAAGLVSPAAVAKSTISARQGNTSQSNISQQFSIMNSTQSSANTNILIKTTKTNSSGQPTYVAIRIPPQSVSTSSSIQQQVIPLTIHQLKLKQQALTGGAGDKTSQSNPTPVQQKSNVILTKSEGYSTADHGYGHGNMVSSFPYGSNNESTMYSQQSNMPSYIDGHNTHPSQNTIYPGYPSQTSGGHPASMGVGVSPQAIGVAEQVPYLQPGQAANQRVPISHTTRASPITVQWLLQNYETADGVSLPRSTLYHHYLRHCADNKIDAVNAASFGKLIRSVFLGLKTRRLGTRGNSKYHYYGIRVKPNSPLARLTDDTQVALRATPSTNKRSFSSTNLDEDRGRLDSTGGSDDNSSHQQYLGDVSDGLPNSPELELNEALPEGVSRQTLVNFGAYYRLHCQALLEVISTLRFEMVESLWQAFYKSPAAENRPGNGTLGQQNDYNFSKMELLTLCNYEPLQKFVKETDYVLYQKLVNVLVPDVLRAVPSSLTQTIRNFAKSLENMLIGSMSEMPKEIVNVKVAAVSAFSQTLRRYTSLNHLAQAARAVLQNPQQINQMWNDLNKVDFNNVQEQSSWVCQCDEALITKLETDFKTTLSQQHSLEQWAEWLESVVGTVLESHEGRDSYPKAARQFLLNWSFYSSMIIRDLTLRSAASFGSFHLIRLLYDEYMFYLIEHKVAKHTGKSPMSVMAECVGLSSMSQGNFNGAGNNEEDEDLDDSSNDGSNLNTPTSVNAESAIQTRPANQPEPMMSQTAVQYDEPLAKRMKQEYAS